MDADKQLAVLNEIQRLLTRNYPSARQFLNHILAKAIDLLGADSAFIGLVQSHEDRKVVRVWDRFHRLVGATAGHWDSYVRDVRVGTRDLPSRERSLTGRVARLKVASRVGDVRRATFFRADNRSTRSALAMPVLSNGDVLAVINLESKKLHFYTREHQDILAVVARMIAPRLEQMMVREGLCRSIGHLLNDVEKGLASVPIGPFEPHTFDAVAKAIARSFQRPRCRIWLLNRARTVLVLRGSNGGRRRSERRLGPRAKRDPVWRVVLGQTVSGRGGEDRDGALANGRLTGAQSDSSLAISILAGEHPLGVIEVTGRPFGRSQRHAAFSASEVETLQIVQGQVASALEMRSLQLARRQQATRQARRMSQLARIFSRPDLTRTLEAAVAHVLRLVSCRYCSIFLWDETRRLFTLRASNRIPRDLVDVAAYGPGEGLTGWVAQHGRPLNLRDRTRRELARVTKGLRWKGKYEEPRGRRELRRAPFLAVPVFLGGRSRGAIRVSGRRGAGPFTESDLEMLTAVATHVASIVAFRTHTDERLRLTATLRRVTSSLNARLAALKETSDAALINGIVKDALEEARSAMNADVLTLYPYDPDRGDLMTPPICAGEIRHPDVMAHRLYPDDAPWRVFTWRHASRFIRNVRHRRGFEGTTPPRDGFKARARFSVREGIVSVAGLRLEVAAAPVGMLFVNFRQPQPFDSAQRELIESFAGSLGPTLEIVRLHRLMHRLASREVAAFLSQDLHDMVLTFLTGSVLERCDAARDRIVRGDVLAALSNLRAAEGAINYVVDEIRSLMGLLIERRMEERGLVSELRFVRTAVWEAQGCSVDLPNRNVALPNHLRYHFYMMVLSAVSNAIAKGRASHVQVAIGKVGNRVRLRIGDNGCGFDVRAALADDRHYGLRGIQRRARLLGGDAVFESHIGHGTTIRIDVPVSRGLYDTNAA